MEQHRGPNPVPGAALVAEPDGLGARRYVRPLAGLGALVAIGVVIAVAAGLFRGSFTETVPVTVISQRAGLVMNPDAKVRMRGVQVGKVSTIEHRPDGTATLHLAMDPSTLHLIPSNVNVDITSSTVFGAKFVELQAPREPSPRPLGRNQVLDSNHVTVEIDTTFQRLVSVLSKLDPPKLNATLRAIAQAFNGRGERIGRTLTDLNTFLAKIEPSLPNLSHDFAAAPEVVDAYADAAPDLLTTADNATRLSDTLVDEQQNFDALLVSSIALADIGNDVIGANREPLTSVAQLLVPTTDILNHYHDSLRCGIGGLIPFMKVPELPDPGVDIDATFNLGIERYRYPKDLPKVAAKGGTYCQQLGLPVMQPGFRPPSIVADTGSNPWQYGNQGILLNSDALKQFLFGPLDGPPRNTAQTGQPG